MNVGTEVFPARSIFRKSNKLSPISVAEVFRDSAIKQLSVSLSMHRGRRDVSQEGIKYNIRPSVDTVWFCVCLHTESLRGWPPLLVWKGTVQNRTKAKCGSGYTLKMRIVTGISHIF